MLHRCNPNLLLILRCLHLAIFITGLLHNVASAQVAEENAGIPACIETKTDISTVLPVAFPAMMSPIPVGAAVMSPGAAMSAQVPQVAPRPMPAPVLRMPAPPQSEKESLMISKMNGEVHFKHLAGPHFDPASRALQIETGGSQSWCEFKMNTCTGRVWKESDVTVLPDSCTVILKNGALIVNVKGEGGKYSIICGDLLCRAETTTIRVQKTERNVSFQVMEGTVTVCNRATGEVYNAAQVVQPAK